MIHLALYFNIVVILFQPPHDIISLLSIFFNLIVYFF